MFNYERTTLEYELYSSGFVNRYHNHPSPGLRNAQDTTDGHSNRMLKIYMMLFDFPNLHTMAYICMHDAAEGTTGDMPYLTKINNPELKSALDDVEEYRLEELYGCFPFPSAELNWEEKLKVKLVDLLESFLFQCIHAPHRMKMPDEMVLFWSIQSRGYDLGIRETVRSLMIKGLRFNGAITEEHMVYE